MQKVYLDILPRNKRNHIDWINSVGYEVEFEYNDLKSSFKIVEYYNCIVTINYKNNLRKIHTSCLRRNKIAKLIGLIVDDYKFKPNEIVETVTGKIKILSQIRLFKNNSKGYIYSCFNCNYKGKKSEGNFIKKSGCIVCQNYIVKTGFNDIWTINPSLGSLLLNKDDGYINTQNSSKKVDFKCPNCNFVIQNTPIYWVNKHGLKCRRCSDGISYAEKFVFNVLLQLKIDFEKQKRFFWSNNKRYDYYINNKNIIIEVHGIQHFKYNGFSNLGGYNLEETIQNDKFKYNIAMNNYISEYIVIDAKY